MMGPIGIQELLVILFLIGVPLAVVIGVIVIVVVLVNRDKNQDP